MTVASAIVVVTILCSRWRCVAGILACVVALGMACPNDPAGIANPVVTNSGTQRAVAACKAQRGILGEDDCLRYAKNKAKLLADPCPDDEATEACHSFHETLSADDADIMSDLAFKNVYMCFRPHEDIFFEVWFSEPGPTEWKKRDFWSHEAKGYEDIPGNYAAFGTEGVAYYKAGIGEEYMTIQGNGLWFTSLPVKATWQEKNARTSRNTLFAARPKQQEFLVQQTRFAASERYENQGGTQTVHRVTVQLGTGRYVDTYEHYPSGEVFSIYSGRCLSVPATRDAE